MKRVLVIAACLLVFFGSVLWRAPAWPLADLLRSRVAGLQLGAESGSLWQGEFSYLSYRGLLLRELQWRIQPLALLRKQPLAIRVADPAELNAQLGVSDGQVLVSALELRGRIAPLLRAVQMPSMGFDGLISAEIEQAVISADGCQTLVGGLRVDQLSGDVAGLDALGEIRAELSCDGGALQLRIDDNNPLRLRGSIVVDAEGVPRGQLRLSPPAGSELYNSMVQFFGRPRGGDFILRL